MMVSLSPVGMADGLASLKRIRSKREVAKSMRHRLRSRESSADCGIEWEYGILWSERTRGPFTDGLSLGGSRGLPLTGTRSSDQLAKQLGCPHRVPRSSRSRQAPTRARNARIENTVRTPFQKFHTPSYAALARASSPGDAPGPTLYSGAAWRTARSSPRTT